MNKLKQSIKELNPTNIQRSDFKDTFTSCIILTANHQILLQQRGENWTRYPGLLATFGGKIESFETPMQGLIRELKEELEATVDPTQVVELGVVTEEITHYQELIYLYFWHDIHQSIQTCHEGEPRYFDQFATITQLSNVMADALWGLKKCYDMKLIK